MGPAARPPASAGGTLSWVLGARGPSRRCHSFVGDKAEEHRGIMRIQYPVEHGVVQDWGDMEKVWSHVYSKDHLDAASENHPVRAASRARVQARSPPSPAARGEPHQVLLTEAPLNPSRNREKAAEIMFEVFKVPALFFSPQVGRPRPRRFHACPEQGAAETLSPPPVTRQAVLSLYASGRTTGLVLDVGDGVTHTVPVYQGFAVQNAIQRSDVGGRDVTRYLQVRACAAAALWRPVTSAPPQRLLRKAGYPLHTSSEFEIVRAIKERMCYVRIDPTAPASVGAAAGADEFILPDGSQLKVRPCARGCTPPQSTTWALTDERCAPLASSPTPRQVDEERHRAPEVLFDPSLVGMEYPGVHQSVLAGAMATDMELRPELLRNVVVAGGSTLFSGASRCPRYPAR